VRTFDATGALLTTFHVAPDNRGSARIDLANDSCTLFYTSQGPNVKRFGVCSDRQLQDFNTAPIPGGYTGTLRILPDGGVLVATANEITRLSSAGVRFGRWRAPGVLQLGNTNDDRQGRPGQALTRE